MLYDESELSGDLKNFLYTNGSFFNRLPSNLPTRIKVHVYIIKISIINSMHFIGKFDPYISLECGDLKLTEKFKTDSVEPLIGK
jgi:hypothetical protein